MAKTADKAAPSPAPHDDMEPKGGLFGFFLMVIGMFMAILDIQVVASSLPQIQAGISASADEITWVQTAYLVAEVVMIPLSGWLARVMSSRWLFAASSAGFTIMSLACAMAWDTSSMLVFRAMQGFLGGAMIPTVFASIYKLLPPEKRIMGTVVTGLTASVAPALGPTLGGYLTDMFSWHWLFLANVGPGILITILVPIIVDFDRPNWRLVYKIDFIGILLVAGFLGALEFVLDEGARNDWFESRMIVGFSILSAVSGILLIWRETSIEHPVIELRTFGNRNFTIGCILSFVLGMCLIGQTYMLPQFLSHVRGYSSLQVGEVMAVTGTVMFIGAPIAGKIGHTVDPRKILLVGFAIVSCGLYLNSHMTTEVGFDQLVLPQATRGFGLVLNLVTITAVALGTLPRHLVNMGSSLFNVFRNMGGAVGLALINTQWDGRYDRHYWWIVEKMSDTNQLFVSQMQNMTRYFAQFPTIGGTAQEAAFRQLTLQIQQQASIMAWNDVFLLLAAIFILIMPLTFLLAKPRAAVSGGH
ncbi:drug resistance transporter, EmrB/QacA subfamily [Cohaesibacter marisflavi]|uniref:Drug resistance transporter, EmrB/QacA subfamily n=1 Tax=Cohaesibacter marisflavi TaxID=655353 RepID=A0A1I5F075_9HYPH|nr:DHA2 family efflux MFS transporter permease subunit [Cohaesibacter marisflavi]SFO17188.1 drug resistance transporter, EmrB/QacA subfamily [Cohaesibacter marisflavi]